MPSHGAQLCRMCDDLKCLLHKEGWREQVSARMRVILEGIEEGLRVPKTRAGLQVLYEDYLPVRMCLRLVFTMVTRVLEEHV